jgi:hypothetical protein
MDKKRAAGLAAQKENNWEFGKASTMAEPSAQI